MPYKIKILAEERTIELIRYGVVTPSEVAEAINKVDDISKEKGYKRLIVDAREITEGPGTSDIYQLVSQFPRRVAHAVIIKQRQVETTDLSFAENVAVNRGIFFKLFFNHEDARKWLSAF